MVTATAFEQRKAFFFILSAPDSPPQDITAVNTDKNSIMVRWKSIPEQDRNGIILGFKLTHMKISATLHMNKPVDEEAKLWPRFETIIDGDTYVTVLSSKVKPFAWYCIKMLGFTRKGEGRESSCVFLRTKESGKARVSMLPYLILFIPYGLLYPAVCLSKRVNYLFSKNLYNEFLVTLVLDQS